MLYLMSMATWVYKNLKKLDAGPFGPYKMTEGLAGDLRHLRVLGYIDVPSGIRSIPSQGHNLSEYVQITPIGKEFVKVREALRLR